MDILHQPLANHSPDIDLDLHKTLEDFVTNKTDPIPAFLKELLVLVERRLSMEGLDLIGLHGNGIQGT